MTELHKRRSPDDREPIIFDHNSPGGSRIRPLHTLDCRLPPPDSPGIFHESSKENILLAPKNSDLSESNAAIIESFARETCNTEWEIVRALLKILHKLTANFSPTT